MRLTKIASLVLGLALLSSAALAAGDNLTCGLIADPGLDLPGSPLFELLNVDLTAQPGLALLERSQIDKVLQEQALQEAFMPGGGSARRQLGQLLKADLLVILKGGETQEAGESVRYVDVVVSETGHGLRLYAERLEWDTANPAQTVDKIAVGVGQARRKLSEEIRVIVAVPPFISDDLTHVYDSLQGAYAQLLMRGLAALRGVHVVELAEARALADETRLTGVDAVVKPIMPFFVEGHYRNEGRGEGRQVSIHLAVSRPGEETRNRDLGPLNPNDVEAQLRDLLGQWLAGLFDTQPVAYDPQAEIEMLRNRATEYRRLGDWSHALDMIESILMIAPGDLDARRQAVELCGKMVDSLTDGQGQRVEVTIDSVIAHLDYIERGCEHLAHYLRLTYADPLQRKGFHSLAFMDFMSAFWEAGSRIFTNGVKNERIKARVDEIGRLERDTILEFYDYLGARGEYVHLSKYPKYKIDFAYNVVARFEQTKKEFFDDRLRGIRAFSKASDPNRLETMLTYMDVSKEDRATPEYQRFLSEVAAIPGDEYDVLVEYLNDNNVEEKEEPKIATLSNLIASLDTRTLQPRDREFLFQKIGMSCKELATAIENRSIKRALPKIGNRKIVSPERFTGPSGVNAPASIDAFRNNISRQGQPALEEAGAFRNDIILTPIRELTEEIRQWVALDNGCDLLWNDHQVFLMRQKGVIERIHTLVSNQKKINTVSFDGRWIWMPGDDELIIADATGKIVGKVGQDDGLPPGELWVTGLEPGRVCVVGAFDRTWCANVSYDDKGEKKVDVFHEARLKEGLPSDAGLAFQPRYLVTLKAADGSPVVLVGRGFEPVKGSFMLNPSPMHPLILYPDQRKVKVVGERFSGSLDQERIKVHGNRMYWIARDDEVMNNPWSGGSLADMPLNRLYSWGASDVKIRIEPVTLEEASFDRHSFEVRLLFINDNPYMVKDGTCWLIDLEKGMAIWREVALGGIMSRSGQSNFYGAVALNGSRYENSSCYKISLSDKAGATIGNVDELTSSSTKVIEKSLLFGHKMNVRLAQLKDLGSVRYTTATVTLVDNGFYLDHKMTEGNRYVWVEGWEQRDPILHELLKSTRLIWQPDGSSIAYSSVEEDGDIFFRIKGIDLNNPPKGIPVKICDYLGNPLAGVDVYEISTLNSIRNDNRSLALKFWSGKTNSDGEAVLIDPILELSLGMGFNRNYMITGRDFGGVSYSCSKEPPTEWHLRVLRSDVPVKALSIMGSLKNMDGTPLANARITCVNYLYPDMKYTIVSPGLTTWETSPDGEFSIIPDRPMTTQKLPMEVPTGAIAQVKITPDETSDLPSRFYQLEVGKKYEINNGDNLSSHTIGLQNAGVKPIDPEKDVIYITRRESSDSELEKQLLDEHRITFKYNVSMEDNPVFLELGDYYIDSHGIKSTKDIHVDSQSPENIVFHVAIDEAFQSADAQKVKKKKEITTTQLVNSVTGEILNGKTCLPAEGIYICRNTSKTFRDVKALTPALWSQILSPGLKEQDLPPEINEYKKWLASSEVVCTDEHGVYYLPVPVWEKQNNLIAFGSGYDMLEIKNQEGSIDENKIVTYAPAFIFPWGESPKVKPMAPPAPYVIYDNIDDYNQKNPATASNISLFYEGFVQDAWGKPLAGVYVAAFNGELPKGKLVAMTSEQWHALHAQEGKLEIQSEALKPLHDIFGEVPLTRSDSKGFYRLRGDARHRYENILLMDENILGYMILTKGRPTGSNHTMYLPAIRMYASATLAVEPTIDEALNKTMLLRPVYKYSDDSIVYKWNDVYRGWTNPGYEHFIFDESIEVNGKRRMIVPAEIDFKIAFQPDDPEWKTSAWSEPIRLKSGDVRDLGKVIIIK